MADRDKRDRDKDEKSEFESLNAFEEGDWSSALDEWDAAFSSQGADLAVPAPIASAPVAPSPTSSSPMPGPDVVAAPPPEEAGARLPEAPTPMPDEVASTPEVGARLPEAPTPMPGEVASAPEAGARFPEAPTPIPEPLPLVGEAGQALPLPPLEGDGGGLSEVPSPFTGADFDLNLDQSEALGQMLGSLEAPDLLADIPGAVMDGPAPETSSEEERGLRPASSPDSPGSERPSSAEFEESTRMVSADDQRRLAQEAMAPSSLSEGSEFEESTRLVSAEDQGRLLTKSLEALSKPQGVGEVAPEESLTLDGEFYDSIAIAGEEAGEVPVSPRSDDVEGVAAPSPGDLAKESAVVSAGPEEAPEMPPEPSAPRERKEVGRPLVAELDLYDEDSGLGSLDLLLGMKGGNPPPSPPARPETSVDGESGERRAIGASTPEPLHRELAPSLDLGEAVSSAALATAERSEERAPEGASPSGAPDAGRRVIPDESSQPAASAPTLPAAVGTAPEPSLDAILGVSSPTGVLATASTPEPDLSSLDALLGLSGSAGAVTAAAGAPVPPSAGAPPTLKGWELPEPPVTRRLGALAERSRNEVLAVRLPALDFLTAGPAPHGIDALPEALPHQASDGREVHAAVQWLEAEARAAEEAPVSAALEAAAGTLLETLLGDEEGAGAHYLEAIGLDGSHLPARRGQLRCALRAQDWGAALEALWALEEGTLGVERSAYQSLAADLALSTMGDTDRAQATYERLLEAPGTAMAGLLGLCDVAVMQADAPLLASGLRRLAESVRSDALAAPLALEAARRLEVLEEDEVADLCFARAAADGSDVGHLARKGRARIALRRKDWPEAAERLRNLVAQREPGVVRAQAEAQLFRVLQTRTGGKEEALKVAQSLAKDAPEDLAAALRLASAAEAEGRPADAAAAWEQAGRVARSAALGAVFLSFAGEIQERFLGEPEAATASYLGAAERAPTLSLPTLLLAEQRTRSSAPMRRVDAWKDRAKACEDPRERDAAWAMAARALVGQERSGEALSILQEAAATGTPGRAMLRELAGLQVTAGEPEAAAATLGILASQVELALAAALRHRAVALRAGRGEEHRLAAYAEGIAEDDQLHSLRWALQRAHRAAGDALAWETTLEAEAETSENPGRAARLWRLVGWSRLWRGEAEAAKEPLERAIGLDPTDAHARIALLRIGAARGDFEEVVRLEAELAEQAPGPGSRCLWEIRRATCLENRLQRADEAAEIYRALAAAHPGWEVPRENLLRLRRWGGDRRQVAAALRSQAETAPTPAIQVARLVLAAAELDLAGEPDRAAPILAEAAALSPEDPVVRSLQDAVEIEMGNWAGLADRALAALGQAPDDAARVLAYATLAAVDRDGREDLQSAILAYESILRIDATSPFVLRELELYYPAERKVDELAEVAHRLAEASAGRERVAHAMEWSRLRADAGDVQGAVAGLRMALEGDPDDLPTLTRLELHARREGRYDELARIYEAVSGHFAADPRARAVFLLRAAEASLAGGDQATARRQLSESSSAAPRYLPAVEERLRQSLLCEDWDEAVAAAEARVEASAQRGVKVASRFLAGVLSADTLKDEDRALANLQAVLELSPGHTGAFERLRALLRHREDWAGLARLLSVRLEVVGEQPGAVDLLWELAQVERGPLNDSSAAKITLRRLIALDEQRLDAVQAATALYQADEQYVEMADMLIRQARLEQDPAGLVRIFFRLGELYDEKIPDPKRAVASFTKVLQMDPGHMAALDRLSSIQLRQEDWKSALAITGRLLELEKRPEHRIVRLLSLADILERGYRDPRRAREALIKALEIDPLDLRAVGELAEFYQRQNDRRSLMVHLDRTVTVVRGKLVENPFEPEHYRTLARLFEWRRASDQQVCAASALLALGHGTSGERELLAAAGRLAPRLETFAEPELDELLFPVSVISGFRHTFRLMGTLLGRPFRADLAGYGAGKATRVTRVGDPLREQAAQMAARMGVPAYELHVVTTHPKIIAVEPYDPPVILLGSAVVEGASEAERAFALGRCFKIIQSQMVLPLKVEPARLRGLVAGIVRQFIEDFEPREVPPVELQEQTRSVAKQLSRKVKGELMPFAYECAGLTDYDKLSEDLSQMANRAGLLASGDLGAAVRVLLREAGQPQGSGWSDSPLAATARGVASVESLLRYAVSEEYFELRGRMGLA